jgi:hypothetical protein
MWSRAVEKRSPPAVDGFHAPAGRKRASVKAHVVRRTAIAAAIALLLALILMAEAHLTPELRLGFFEATYVSP